MIPTRRTTTTLLGAMLAAFACVVVALGTATPAAAAKTPCGERVLDDWYDNGRIDRLYEHHCYEDAIDLIPKDLLDYVDAEQVISRALQQALRGKLDEGGCDPSPDGSKDDCVPGGSNGGKNGGKKGGKNGADNGGTTDPGGNPEVTPDVDTSGTSSVPIPLLVLGGMSVALLGAGGLGYLSRRRQAARLEDDSPF